MEAKSAVTILASPDAIYGRWHDVTRLPEFMDHLEAVVRVDVRRSHWTARGPAGTTVEWDAEITEEVSGERIAWRSIEGSSLENSGVVEIVPAPGDRGTEVHVSVQYAPPGGRVGSVVVKLLGEDPTEQVADDLRRFKQLVETGEIARSEGAPLGTSSAGGLRQRPARPLEKAGGGKGSDKEARA